MCGIVYSHSINSVSKKVAKRYTKQRSRGSDGFGFVAFSNGKVRKYERYAEEKEALAALREVSDTHVLFHHRYPTSTENVEEAAHPIKVMHRELKHTYYVVHNGVISNAKTLRANHLKLGYEYTTEITTQYVTKRGNTYIGETVFNDSEALAIELCRNIERGTPIAAEGSAAFIVLQCDKTGKHVKSLYYGTNGGNPLKVDRQRDTLTIASEGHGEAVRAMQWHVLDIKTNVLATLPLDMKGYAQKVGYGAYTPYYSSGYNYSLDDEEDIQMLNEPPYETMSAHELEDALYDLNMNIKIAEQSGEEEELEELRDERQYLLDSLAVEYEKTQYAHLRSRV